MSYDRKAVGQRLREQRKRFGWDRKYVAGKIGVVEKFYADIERGNCGMSVETLIALAELYEITMDALIYGAGENAGILTEDKVLLRKLEAMPLQQQNTCRELLKVFMNGVCAGECEESRMAEAKCAEGDVV